MLQQCISGSCAQIHVHPAFVEESQLGKASQDSDKLCLDLEPNIKAAPRTPPTQPTMIADRASVFPTSGAAGYRHLSVPIPAQLSESSVLSFWHFFSVVAKTHSHGSCAMHIEDHVRPALKRECPECVIRICLT